MLATDPIVMRRTLLVVNLSGDIRILIPVAHVQIVQVEIRRVERTRMPRLDLQVPRQTNRVLGGNGLPRVLGECAVQVERAKVVRSAAGLRPDIDLCSRYAGLVYKGGKKAIWGRENRQELTLPGVFGSDTGGGGATTLLCLGNDRSALE